MVTVVTPVPLKGRDRTRVGAWHTAPAFAQTRRQLDGLAGGPTEPGWQEGKTLPTKRTSKPR